MLLFFFFVVIFFAEMCKFFFFCCLPSFHVISLSSLVLTIITAFDVHWQENGLIDKALKLLTDWVDVQEVKGMTSKVYREPGRTPLLFIEVAPTTPGLPTVLLYGAL